VKILLLTAHDIAEYDDLRMLTDMGHDVFSIGAYTNPATPASVMRPALDVPAHPELEQACIAQRERHAEDGDRVQVGREVLPVIDWAKADLAQEIVDWADVIICHHYLESWIVAQWPRLRDKRVIWRTCGQSDARLEEVMAELRPELQIIRYSPAEARAFTRMGVFAGEDALIRFGKYPGDYGPWIGDEKVVGNVTQNMAGRGQFCGLDWYLAATAGLPVKPAGLQSEVLPGGTGALSYADMLEYLRDIRAYAYTGTQPAPYTLGLLEAMMTGVPIVSIGPEYMWVPDLFEGHELTDCGADDPRRARAMLETLLDNDELAADLGAEQRARATELFGIETVSAQWADFLGAPVRQAVAA
jgi:glycosyltransferase involved in cell wall biosynthesis